MSSGFVFGWHGCKHVAPGRDGIFVGLALGIEAGQLTPAQGAIAIACSAALQCHNGFVFVFGRKCGLSKALQIECGRLTACIDRAQGCQGSRKLSLAKGKLAQGAKCVGGHGVVVPIRGFLEKIYKVRAVPRRLGKRARQFGLTCHTRRHPIRTRSKLGNGAHGSVGQAFFVPCRNGRGKFVGAKLRALPRPRRHGFGVRKPRFARWSCSRGCARGRFNFDWLWGLLLTSHCSHPRERHGERSGKPRPARRARKGGHAASHSQRVYPHIVGTAPSAPVAVYPGSFDPMTLGHVDILERAAHIFARVLVAVGDHPQKPGFFPPQMRVQLVQASVAHISNAEVVRFEGLVIDLCRQHQATVLVRGLRATGDFESEFRMALANRELAPSVETVFLLPRADRMHISSSLVREIAGHGGEFERYVTPAVAAALRTRTLTS